MSDETQDCDPAADPDYTIDERDRIAEMQDQLDRMAKAIGECMTMISQVASECAKVTGVIAAFADSPEGRKFLESMAVDVGEDDDGSPADGMRAAYYVMCGQFERGMKALYGVVCENFGHDFNVTRTASRIEVRRRGSKHAKPDAMATIYESGRANTGGRDKALRASLRSVLEAEGFDVRC